MASGRARILLGLLVAGGLAACNPSVVQPDDPLYRPKGTRYHLGRPLSGPFFRNANMFGQQPVLPAGTEVRVLRIERAPRIYFNDVGMPSSPTRAWHLAAAPPVYRIYFDGPAACRPTPCMAHWRLPDDAAFDARFETVFRSEDPLAQVAPDTRELIQQHRVASWFTEEEILLAFGDPNFVQISFGIERWLYETRYCDADARYLAVPNVALVFDEGGDLLEPEKGRASDFYAVAEPFEPGGLCWRTFEERFQGGPPVAYEPGKIPGLWPDLAREYEIMNRTQRTTGLPLGFEYGYIPSGSDAPW